MLLLRAFLWRGRQGTVWTQSVRKWGGGPGGSEGQIEKGGIGMSRE